MISTWAPEINYYVILDKLELESILDDILIDIMGYKNDKVWKLMDVCRGLKYLENNKVAINIQISNPLWTEVKLKDGTVINARGVVDYISSQDFDLAKYYFQKNTFLTQLEYMSLPDRYIIINN